MRCRSRCDGTDLRRPTCGRRPALLQVAASTQFPRQAHPDGRRSRLAFPHHRAIVPRRAPAFTSPVDMPPAPASE